MEDLNKLSSGFVNKIIHTLLLGLVFLLPLFSIPTQMFSLNISKMILVSIVASLLLILWAISIFKNKIIIVPSSVILLSGVLVSLAYLVSSLYSPAMKASLIGHGIESGTFVFVLLAFLLTFFFSIYSQSKKIIQNFYFMVASSFILLALSQIIWIVWGTISLPFGFSIGEITNFFGGWSELTIFSGLMAVISFVVLESSNKNHILKYLMLGLLLVSLFFVSIVNIQMIWIVLAVLSFSVLVYKVTYFKFKKDDEDVTKWKKVPALPVAILVLSLVFIIAGNLLSSSISSFLDIKQINVYPSFESTLEVTKKTLDNNLLLGAGPNQFVYQWLLYRPENTNNTVFWNFKFNTGSGFIQSTLVNVGVLGFLAWIILLGALIYNTFRLVVLSREDGTHNYLFAPIAFGVAYLWLFMIIYTPGISLFMMTFAFTGIFIAFLTEEGFLKNKIVLLSGSKIRNTVGNALPICLVVLVMVGGYFVARNFIAYGYYQKSLAELNSSNMDKASENIAKALSYEKDDLYYRVSSGIKRIKMQALLSRKDIPESEMVNQFQQIFNDVVSDASKAIEINKLNYLNWVSLGEAYETISTLGVKGAYENTNKAYENASALAPTELSVYLSLARLESVNKNNQKAKEYIVKVLNKKPDYREAYLFLSKIQLSENNVDGAIGTMELATRFLPNDPEIHYQSGVLKYANKDYAGAVASLERSVELNPTYSNAKYFLGISYSKIGRGEEAIRQFEDLAILNPENVEVKSVLDYLKNK